MTFRDIPVATRETRQPQPCEGVCVAVLLLALLIPLRVLADASAESADGISSNPQIALLAPAAMLSSTALIGTINIVNGSIFDLDNPAEDKLLYRLANRAHATTRPKVIQQQLLFAPGDRFSVRKLEESERILRSNRYIQDAEIVPVVDENGVVNIEVRTTDVWTLIPRVSFSRSGGENAAGIGIKEMNLFGTGMQIQVLYKSDVDRDSKIIKLADRQLGDSWYSLSALYANNSDGHSYQFALGLPFYALNSTAAYGFSFLDNEQIDALYDRGEIVAQYRNEASSYEIFKGWSNGLKDGWTRRYTMGLAYDEHRFTEVDGRTAPMSIVPDDRKLVYPFVGIDFMQDRFEKAENHDQINRTEDRYLGTRFGARLGVARNSLGSDRDAWLINAGAQTGFGSSKKSSLILASNLATRVEDDGPQNLTIDVSARYYRRQSDSRLFYASLSGTYGHNLDIDQQLLLGGDNGLRGYPLRYQTGDKSVLLTLEQRFFSDWYPFRLFHVGGAVFFDAGRAWGDSPVSDRHNGLLKDAGLGLRIGNTRSGQGRVTHIDLAFPLDGDDSIKDVQLLIGTKKSF